MIGPAGKTAVGTRREARSSSLALAAVLAVAGCGSSEPDATPDAGRVGRDAGPSLATVLPRDPGPNAPGFADVDRGGRMPGSELVDVETCERCHQDVAAQWRTSAHSYASFNNPVYRVSVEGVRSEVSRDASRHCASCHDVALLFDRAMGDEVAPTDVRGHFGVNCRTCHGVARVTGDGNGSWILANEPIPVPVRGDAGSLRRHIDSVVKPPLRTAQLCGSCHRAFLGPETGNGFYLAGADDLLAWGRSEYAGSELSRIDDVSGGEQTCQDCHMPDEAATRGDTAADDGVVSSHRFLGGHSWLAAMRGDADALARAQAFLRGAASIDVAAVVHEDGASTMPADGAPVRAGERLRIDVVVRNQRVGHRFPGGTPDSADTWVELEIRDADGRLLGEAGTRQEATGNDPTAHRLRALLAEEHGQPVLARQANRFRAAVFNHTLAPRDATVVELLYAVPARLPALPLEVTARLRHRSRNLELARAACAEHSSARGRAFARAAIRFRGEALDACAREPVTEIASTTIWIGAGAESHTATDARPAWLRLYEHGLGMSHGLQERLDEARPRLMRALELLGAEGHERERAMVMTVLGQVAGRQGRTSEALDWGRQAEELVGAHAAIDRMRGDALAQVWRWAEAGRAYAGAAQTAPYDDSCWSQLAVALGSAGDAVGSLEAARRGLPLAPRDPDMLRAQALALQSLAAPETQARAAMETYLRHRNRDDAPGVRARCSATVPNCALERIPIHPHEVRPHPPG